LLPETASAKARTAGHGGSMAKVRNAGRRRFGRNAAIGLIDDTP
jgi:hypothetical protein